MITIDQMHDALGQSVYGNDGDKIGRLGQVFVDDTTGQPEWITVETGLFGTRETFVPIAQADLTSDGVTVPFTKDQVKDAPTVESDDSGLSVEDEERLYGHYGMGGGAGMSTDAGSYGSDAPDLGGPRSYEVGETSADDAMTRSEERLRVDTERVESGRARLRKYVVTEQQNVTVPVTREEVRLEREPITDANRDDAMDGADITEAEHEVVLHEERPVVTTEAVPVERVRVATETVTEDQEVTGEVRKEQIVTEGVDDDPDPSR